MRRLQLARTLLVFSVLALGPGIAHALDDVLFGPEFTFMHPTQGTQTIARVSERMSRHLVDGQPEGAKFQLESENWDQFKGKFTSPNGWWFDFAQEIQVIEVRMGPNTPATYRQYASDIQDAIFVSAANEEFYPAMFRGGGHINISSRSFLKNPVLFRNFVVDLLNHGELFMGVFGYDTNNALPLQMADPETIRAVETALARFDGIRDQSIFAFATEMSQILFNSKDHFFAAWHNGSNTNRLKHSAVNLLKFDGGPVGRIELRGVRPQASVDVWIRQIELLNNRLRYLEQFTQPIPLKYRMQIDEPVSVLKHQLDPPVRAEDALRSFYEYVRESGELWANHRDYLWPKWITDGEVEKFEKSEWFLTHECEGELEVRL